MTFIGHMVQQTFLFLTLLANIFRGMNYSSTSQPLQLHREIDMFVSVLLFKEYVYHEYFMYNTVLSENRLELLVPFD